MSDVVGLMGDLVGLLGPDAVSDDPVLRRRASVDEATASPVMRAKLPHRPADLVAFPRTPQQIAQTVAAAVRREVPITMRGRGTGDYGQAVPLRAGLVINTSQARRVLGIGPGSISAEAGARMIDLERAAWDDSQQLWLYPPTVQSTLGGFLAGGGLGTGSLSRGMAEDGFVRSLDVVFADGSTRIHRFEGTDCLPFLHAYGTSGVIVAATVNLEPLQDWVSMWAAVPQFKQAEQAMLSLARFVPSPRLVAVDMAEATPTFPHPCFVAEGQASLRAVVTRTQAAAVYSIVGDAGGSVLAEQDGLQALTAISRLSFSNPIWHLSRASHQDHFHIEVAGRALIDRIDEVLAVFPGALVHLDAHRFAGEFVPIGILGAPFRSDEAISAGLAALKALDVRAKQPHTWVVDRREAAVVAMAATSDPHGLLNPGKLSPVPGAARSLFG